MRLCGRAGGCRDSKYHCPPDCCQIWFWGYHCKWTGEGKSPPLLELKYTLEFMVGAGCSWKGSGAAVGPSSVQGPGTVWSVTTCACAGLDNLFYQRRAQHELLQHVEKLAQIRIVFCCLSLKLAAQNWNWKLLGPTFLTVSQLFQFYVRWNAEEEEFLKWAGSSGKGCLNRPRLSKKPARSGGLLKFCSNNGTLKIK